MTYDVKISGQKLMVFRAGGPASLTDAVEASCAVPGVWPVITIAGRRYMDGGIASITNADLVDQAERVVIIAPRNRGIKRADSPTAQLAALGLPGLAISPDAIAAKELGSNPLDPAARVASAKAGLAQATREADRLRPVWDN